MNSAFTRSLVIGTSTIAIQCALELKRHAIPVELVEYQPASISPLPALCLKNKIPYSHLEKVETTEKLQTIFSSCLIVSAFSTYIFSPDIVSRDHLDIINYHNALLPKHAGRNAEAWAIFSRDKHYGITWHYVSDSIDGGDIITQRAFPLPESLTSLGLLKKQHTIAFSAFQELLPSVLNKTASRTRQERLDPGNLHYARDIPGGGILNPEWKNDEISAFLRAMDYGPLHILGRPRICLDGKEYIWKAYDIETHSGEVFEKKSTIHGDDISMEEGHMRIRLRGISKWER